MVQSTVFEQIENDGRLHNQSMNFSSYQDISRISEIISDERKI